MIAILVALGGLVCADAAPADHAGRHRRRRRGIRRGDVVLSRRDVHQAQADDHLRAVRRGADRRADLRQAVPADRVRFDVPPHERKAGAS